MLDPARADERFSDPLLSQAELLTSRAVAGAVVDSMPALRMVTTRDLPLSFLGEVAVPAAAGPVSLQIAFGRDSFIVRGTSGQWSAPYGSAVESHGIRFAVLHRPDAATARLRVLSREAAISALLAHLRVKPRLNTDIVDVTYSAPDPYVAQHVLNRVVDIFKSASAEDAQQRNSSPHDAASSSSPNSRSTIRSWPTRGRRSRRFASAPAPTGRGRRWRVSRLDWRESNCSVSNSRQSDVPTRVS